MLGAQAITPQYVGACLSELLTIAAAMFFEKWNWFGQP